MAYSKSKKESMQKRSLAQLQEIVKGGGLSSAAAKFELARRENK